MPFKDIEKRKEYQRNYQREYHKTYRLKPERAAYLKEYMANYREGRVPKPPKDIDKARKLKNLRSAKYRKANPEKSLAQDKLNIAVKGGKIIRPEKCQVCKLKTKVHGHHIDYSKPLEVIWLCPKCHAKEHKV